MANITKITRKKGATYKVRIRKPDSPTVTKTFSSKNLAQKWARKTELEIEEGTYFDKQEAASHTVAELVDRYLKEELKITRARVPSKQIHTTHAERERLLKFGKPLGRAIEELISIVTPGAFYRWVRDEKTGKPKPKNPKGGQRKPKEIRELVLKIAAITGFGLTRIVGEMRKLGIKKISRQTVRNILKEEGIQPNPDRTHDRPRHVGRPSPHEVSLHAKR